MPKDTVCLFLASCTILAACGGSTEPSFTDHPSGWQKQATGSAWYDPKNPAHSYRATQTSDPDGTLKDAASQVAANVLLQRKGAKYVSAAPFPPCPGEAGLQTFTVGVASGHSAALQVGFSVWKGVQTVVAYEKPAGTPDDPAAIDAMKSSLCT